MYTFTFDYFILQDLAPVLQDFYLSWSIFIGWYCYFYVSEEGYEYFFHHWRHDMS